jgi:hypothetical protein
MPKTDFVLFDQPWESESSDTALAKGVRPEKEHPMDVLESTGRGLQPAPNYSAVAEALFHQLGCTEDLSLEYIRIALDDIHTFDKKQQDYGPRNISDFGEQGVLVRANDKIARLKNLAAKRAVPANEPIDDAWSDLSVYGVIARMVRKGLWK